MPLWPVFRFESSVDRRIRIFRFKYPNENDIKNVSMIEKACARSSDSCKDLEKAAIAQNEFRTNVMGFSLEIQDCMYKNDCYVITIID